MRSGEYQPRGVAFFLGVFLIDRVTEHLASRGLKVAGGSRCHDHRGTEFDQE
jgi:hypothetical protein